MGAFNGVLLALCSFSYDNYLMTITQTIEIPANRRITLEIPSQIPVGAIASFELVWSPQKAQNNSLDIALEKIWNLCKDSSITVDNFLEMRHQDNDLEEKQYQLFFSGNSN